MIIQKVPHYVDSVLTQEVASAALQGGDVVVAWYTNQVNSQSVVHSHPYYELILPVAGSSVRYSDTLTEKTVYEAVRLSDGSVLRIAGSQKTVGMLVLGLLRLAV